MNYSGNSLIRSPIAPPPPKGLINGVAVLPGQAKISWLQGRNHKFAYIAFTVLCSLINNRNVHIAYSNWKKTTSRAGYTKTQQHVQTLMEGTIFLFGYCQYAVRTFLYFVSASISGVQAEFPPDYWNKSDDFWDHFRCFSCLRALPYDRFKMKEKIKVDPCTL